jgi:hypothetical protein
MTRRLKAEERNTGKSDLTSVSNIFQHGVYIAKYNYCYLWFFNAVCGVIKSA